MNSNPMSPYLSGLSGTISLSEATREFILQHRNEDVSALALRYHDVSGVDIPFALHQIDGWQRARTKLPSWSETPGILFPPHLSMEQCSSEATALYKESLVRRLAATLSHPVVFADLTGGFGVDFSYMSRPCHRAIYVEQQETLCRLALHNFSILNMENATVCHSTAEDFLSSSTEKYDILFLDPARRDTHGKKTYAISDCTPNVVSLLPSLMERCKYLILKLSPMLDHREACRLLHTVSEVHILSVRNECKETLLVVSHESSAPTIYCVNDDLTFTTTSLAFEPPYLLSIPVPDTLLFVPNSSVMKAGSFSSLCDAFNLCALDKNSHIFVERNPSTVTMRHEKFPGRVFRLLAVSSLNRSELRKAFTGITHANLSVRNFPLGAAELSKRLRNLVGVSDGGSTYVFATTVCRKHILLIAEKI